MMIVSRNSNSFSGLALSIICLFVLTSANVTAGENSELPNYVRHAFSLPASIEHLLVADTNADTLAEIITVEDREIRIYFQSETGFNFIDGFDSLTLPGNATGWDLSANYTSGAGNLAIIALVDGRQVLAWPITGSTIQQAQTVKTDLNGFLAKGVNRLHFSRDINGDKFDDLIIPGAGELDLHINNGDGSYQAPLPVNSEMRIETRLAPDDLERRSGQSLSIPMMELRDVNNDGLDDLVSSTDEKLEVFIANRESKQYFNRTPSYTIDIAEIVERLGEFDVDNVDFSNLTGLLALTHQEILEDIDGDGIEDLLLREGGKVSLFAGTPTGMELAQPRQVLRSGGNVLTTFLSDENEDELDDLWLWRVENISVGDIFVWLALSGSIAVEGFVYPNDGEKFARRPSRKVTVNLKFPSIIRLATTAMSVIKEVEHTQGQAVVPISVANVDLAFDNSDLLVLLGNSIDVFLNSIVPENDDIDFLGGLGYSRERDNYEIDIREIIDNLSVASNPELAKVEGRVADIRIPLNTAVSNGDIISVALNQDDLDDIFIFTAHNEASIEGLLLISK